MCSASPLHCCVLASVVSVLSALAWLSRMTHGHHAFIPMHGSPVCTSSMPPVSHVWKQIKSLPSHSQPKHTTSQFCHSFSNLNCKHDFVAFNCQSLSDLFSPLGHECCKWGSLQERINSLSNPLLPSFLYKETLKLYLFSLLFQRNYYSRLNSEIINSIFCLGSTLLIHVYSHPGLLFIARSKEGFGPEEPIWNCLNLMDCMLHIILPLIWPVHVIKMFHVPIWVREVITVWTCFRRLVCYQLDLNCTLKK